MVRVSIGDGEGDVQIACEWVLLVHGLDREAHRDADHAQPQRRSQPHVLTSVTEPRALTLLNATTVRSRWPWVAYGVVRP
jgi:hypothetical protein